MKFLSEIWSERKSIYKLAKNDFKSRYAGSFLGIVWAFIQPCVTVIIYAFIFGSGLKSTPADNSFPFLLYLISGIIPWFFFNDAVNSATNSIIEYSYVLKKMVFNAKLLPVVKIISSLFVHFFFIILGVVIFLLHGYTINFYFIQVIYYSICVFVFSLALSYATSAITVYFKDLSQIVSIILQFSMWLTPIMYDVDIFSSPLIGKILKFNPLFYVVEGYRDAFYRNTWFFEHGAMTIYFWAVVLILFIVGTYLFNKLQTSFTDVL